MVTMRSSARSPAIRRHATFRTRCGRRPSDEDAWPLGPLLDARRRERPWLEHSRVVRNQRFHDERSRVGLERGRYVADLAFEVLSARGIDFERYRTADGDSGRGHCSGTVRLTRKGFVRITEATLVPRAT